MQDLGGGGGGNFKREGMDEEWVGKERGEGRSQRMFFQMSVSHHQGSPALANFKWRYTDR